MEIKNNFKLFNLFFILILNIFSTTTISISDSQDVKSWIDQYLKSANENDLKLVANLLYWSYERSLINLKVAQASKENIELNFRCWQNIAATRLNPSKELPNKIYDQDILESAKKLYENYKRYRDVSDSYAYCIESVLKKSAIENQQVKDGVIELRKTARGIMASSLASAGIFLRVPEENSKKSIKLPNWILKPFNFGINGFVEIDAKYNKAVTKCQNALLVAQQASDWVWTTIETSRSNFYKIYYESLVEFIKSKKINFSKFNIMYSNLNLNGDLPEKLK